ncbi:aldehyde dehydrogenase family protein [Palleronia sp. LCG004]|uniref:aldehyde dehydrogenase family protein n=1 Tax=Palleronia sp. LCG004 TaxID=3079304 RepID=UPI002943E108|nr:aldehyde dehydrogenase family protein [Palleronia sp. LCG004]WOI57740.1 aldehyde dehydrogenase family protein [Palleronia sp. LCG004]
MSDTDSDDLHAAQARLSRAGPATPAERRAHLSALARETRAHAEEIARAIDADFNGRPRTETMLAEVAMVLENIRWTKARIGRWTKAERVRLSPEFWPSRARVERVPLGLVGILAPWNYPVQLALVPLVAALAGGNRVLLKPSEFTPRTSAVLSKIVHAAVGDRARVVEGGAEVAQALTRMPLDGIFYTGSTATGRRVMAAAAETLTPVTLELGGKSPAIVLPGADPDRVARSVMAGKLLNAGQTCIAPDYLLVPEGSEEGILAALKSACRALYPDPSGGDYAAIARPADRRRLKGLLGGGRAVPLMDRMPEAPHLGAYAVLDPDPESDLMREEIFGPILPIVAYRTPDDAARFVRARDVPLALYVYGPDVGACERMVAQVPSGGAMIDDCVLHVAAHALPFGGAGASGMGAYHGEEGFRAFTRPRSIMVRSRFAPIGMSRPPYGKAIERIIRLLLR